MNIANIKYNDVANGEGIRTSIFVSGCTHHCLGCFNQVAWDFNYGYLFNESVEEKIFDSVKPDYIKGISLLGGEPFEKANQKELVKFLKRFKERFPNKTVWCWTGYLYNELIDKESSIYSNECIEMLKMIDVLVDGEFMQELKDISLKFRGSKNQRIIDVKKSLKENKILRYYEGE